MKEYKDRIGQRCKGQTIDGTILSGWYLGTDRDKYVITCNKYNIGANPLDRGYDCKSIEFIDDSTTPEVFENFGKEAFVWSICKPNKEKRTIISTHTNGSCRVLRLEHDLKDFLERGISTEYRDSYELIEDIVIVTINGETKTIDESLDILNKLKE